MFDKQEAQIVDFIKETSENSSKQLFDALDLSLSYATFKRVLARLVSNNYLVTQGRGKATRYSLSPAFELIRPVDLEQYYQKEADERTIREGFNFQLITNTLSNYSVFTENELTKLAEWQGRYKSNIAELSENAYKKELERFAIDLSWKSSQIEGNTYSLLETERLLKEKETASGKTKEEAIMLLNHKDALDFIVQHRDYLDALTVSRIEDIHSILVKDLGVERNLRKRRVGISGINYQPLDNQFQITEALKDACELINKKASIFEKALLALALISYIQPFMDGSKRTARMISNAILMCHGYCPLSFRTVNSLDYKKAMLLFYEQNNIASFKKIFTNQFEFAVNTYF